MDADRGASESHGSDHDAEEDARVAIAQVHRVTVATMPGTQTSKLLTIVSSSRLTSMIGELTKITLGKGVNRHKNKGEIRH